MLNNKYANVCDFGKYQGKMYQEIPSDYLRWMIRENHRRKEYAELELQRRSELTTAQTTQTLEISGNAIDRASQFCLELWIQARSPNQGLYSWLCDFARNALQHGKLQEDLIFYRGVIFGFEETPTQLILHTLMLGDQTTHEPLDSQKTDEVTAPLPTTPEISEVIDIADVIDQWFKES